MSRARAAVPVVVAQLSDTHLDGTVGPRERTRRVAGLLRSLARPVDVVLVTGDIVESAPGVDADAELAWLDSTLAVGVPVLYVPGNSDDRRAFARFLSARGDDYVETDGQVHQVRAVAGLTFFLLDGVVEHEFGGRLEPASLRWLADRIAGTEGPFVVAAHHPPVPLGHPFVDELRLANGEALEALLRHRPNLVAVLCGHTHSAITTTFADRPLLVAPGVHSAGQLPSAYSDLDRRLIDEEAAPALAVHYVHDRRVVTYIHWCSRS